MTIEEAIRHYEESERINTELAKNCVSALAKNHNLENAEKCKQMIEWLRELQERRKAPDIVKCGECKHYKIDHPKANGYHCCYRCHNIFPMKENDFCSRAVRRTE